MTTTALNALDSLPASYFRGRDEQRKGKPFVRRLGESEEDWESRFCGWYDESQGISAAERVEIERKGENV